MDKCRQDAVGTKSVAGHSLARKASSYGIAFVAGGILAAWGTFIIMQAQDDSFAKAAAANSEKAWAPPPMASAQNAPKAKPKTNEASDASAKKKADFDPIAEAERINEINRQNMNRTMRPPTPMGAPPTPSAMRPGAAPARPGIPMSPQPPMQPQPGMP